MMKRLIQMNDEDIRLSYTPATFLTGGAMNIAGVLLSEVFVAYIRSV